MPDLFPAFDIPDEEPDDFEEAFVYKPAPLFDFTTGDFVRDGANRVVMVEGREAYKNWVEKMLFTPYGTCKAYPALGVDSEGAMAEIDRAGVEATFERVITEALIIHPMTERVREFEFTWDVDALHMRFEVQGRDMPSMTFRLNARRQ